MRKQRLLLWLTIVLIGLVTAVPLAFGAGYPGYSQLTNYISELGAHEAPHANWVNFVGFLPIGVLSAAAALLLFTMLPSNWLVRAGTQLLLCVSVAYLGAVLIPCDYGCPVNGSPRQQVHNLLGLIEYLGATLGLALIAAGLRIHSQWRAVAHTTVGCAVAVGISLVLLLIPPLDVWRGLFQRIAEAAIFGWLVWVAWWINRYSETAPFEHQ